MSDQISGEPHTGGEPQGTESTRQLDELVARLQRAAEQLRSGELSIDAAAGLVEDCAALAGQASIELDRRARAAVAQPLPNQDALL